AGMEPSETRLCTIYEFGAGGRATAGVTKTRAAAARSTADRRLRRTKVMFMRETPGPAGATMARPGCARLNRRPAGGRLSTSPWRTRLLDGKARDVPGRSARLAGVSADCAGRGLTSPVSNYERRNCAQCDDRADRAGRRW